MNIVFALIVAVPFTVAVAVFTSALGIPMRWQSEKHNKSMVEE